MNNKMKILVCTHKPGFVLQDDIYTPIQVGKALSNVDLGFLGDDKGDNISVKNKEFCELTAIYWAWKNLTNVDVIGLCHYRRYFNINSSAFSAYLNEIPEERFKNFDFKTTDKKVKELLSTYDIILPKFWRTPWSVKRDFYISVNEEDLEILGRVISNKYPSYMKSYEKFCLGNRRTGCNMFITSKKVFEGYAEWLFDILFEVERYVKISPYTYYRRIFGFMAEILLPVYCDKHGLKIKECQMLFVTSQETNSSLFIRSVKRHLKNLINNLAFFLTKVNREQIIIHEFWDNYLKMDDINIK